MSTPAAQWSVFSLVWMLGMSGLSMAFAYDDLALNQRAEIVPAQVIRTNYDQRGKSFNAELRAPYQGVRVIVEDLHRLPATGDVVRLAVDPHKPTRVRQSEAPRWRWMDFGFIVLVPVGLVVVWGRASRKLRRKPPGSVA